MNSREVIARFESERQALALMNHPTMAKVLDAGSTPQGAPYFVMEYVAGSPITTYCDEHKLTNANGWNFSSRSARECSTLIRKRSSIEISNHRIF